MGQRGVVNSLPPHEQGFEHSENRLPAPPRGSRPEGPARKVGPADGSFDLGDIYLPMGDTDLRV